MNASLATLVYACGIAGLFYFDRDKSIRTSKALWLAVVYLWIIGSRPVSFWLGVTPPSGVNAQLEGSPVDAAFFQILLIAAICVLVHRGSRTLLFLRANLPIIVFFLFCLFSITWSDFPEAALKKWIKAIGDLAMILIVLTDKQPVAALRRLFSRVGFLLIPMSMLFYKYYPYLGHSYDSWTGAQSTNGVSSDKNMLGVITFVILLGMVWCVLSLLWPDEILPHRRRHLLAQGTLLVLGVLVLIASDSVTSLVCFVMGTGLMLTTRLRFIRRKPAAVHVLVLTLAVGTSLVMLLGGGASATKVLGRKPTLTGRTDIWAAVIPMVPNPVVGAGFESFWLSPHVNERLWQLFPGNPLNEAHNGYIEVYLNLGWVGLGLIGIVLIDGYRRSVKAFRREPVLGSLCLAFILTEIVYNITEAGFRMLDPIWIVFLLAVMEASSVADSLVGDLAPPTLALDGGKAGKIPARSNLSAERKSVHDARCGTTSLAIRRAIDTK